MGKIKTANLFLNALKQYEPEAYFEEVCEIFDCIMENRIYDNSPGLDQRQLILILENIETDTRPEKNELKRLSHMASRKVKIAEEVESALRARIRKRRR